jgi:prepilin-type N-terminal cleavage/methylation domain-containing protein
MFLTLRSPAGRSFHRGFTFFELMLGVTIAGIVLTVAVNTYN